MKKILLFSLAALIFTACSTQKKVTVIPTPPVPPVMMPVLTNDVDSMSYALGMNVGADFGKNIKTIPGGKSNLDLLIKGFSTALKGDSTLLKTEVAQTYFREYMTKAQAKDNEAKKAEGEKFLADNALKAGVKTTPSGLQYEVIKEGTGIKPAAVDTVEVHYTGKLPDGKVFDSSVERGQPAVFPLNGVIPGWTEGLQLMTVGSKYKFYIPYELAYGERGAGGMIPPFSPLVFDVELLSVKKHVEAPTVKVETTKKTTTTTKKTVKKK